LVSEGKEEAEVISWYFLNTARSRKVVAELQGGEMVPVRLLNNEVEEGEQERGQAQEEHEEVLSTGTNGYVSPQGRDTRSRRIAGTTGLSDTTRKMHNVQVQVQVERPNIFTLYEQNIGLLAPLIADELKDAADHYPAEWIEAAFREAVQHNKRKWSYIHAILRRWETEGRQAWNA